MKTIKEFFPPLAYRRLSERGKVALE